jgi:hypothetical protein
MKSEINQISENSKVKRHHLIKKVNPVGPMTEPRGPAHNYHHNYSPLLV